jgi:hypothetical protein
VAIERVHYLTAVIDWHNRCVLSRRLSNTLEGTFCLEALEEALRRGCPKVFNTDQGVQFTSASFTGRLESAGAKVSMDGKGRCLDNGTVLIQPCFQRIGFGLLKIDSLLSRSTTIRSSDSKLSRNELDCVLIRTWEWDAKQMPGASTERCGEER